MAAAFHEFRVRVYYEDTDLAGIVYYANYLKFIERARTEWVRELGISQTETKLNDGIVFAVRRVEADYISPAQFDDELVVRSQPIHASAAQITLQQDVHRGDALLFASKVTLIALKENGRPARLPEVLREII